MIIYRLIIDSKDAQIYWMDFGREYLAVLHANIPQLVGKSRPLTVKTICG